MWLTEFIALKVYSHTTTSHAPQYLRDTFHKYLKSKQMDGIQICWFLSCYAVQEILCNTQITEDEQ